MPMEYFLKKYNYDVTIDGNCVGRFSEVSAPDVASDPIEYRDGNFTVRTVGKQPGLVKYGNVTLKWGMTESAKLYNWMKEVESGTINRKTVVLSLYDDGRTKIAEWTINSAWPTKYTAPDFNATNHEVAIETVELAHEGITRDL